MPTVALPLSSPQSAPRIFPMASRLVFGLSLWLTCHGGAIAHQEANLELVARAKRRALCLTRSYPSVRQSLLVTFVASASRREQSSTGAKVQSEIRGQTAEAHIGKGYEDLKDQRYREAAEEFSAALKLAPNLVAVRSNWVFVTSRSDSGRRPARNWSASARKPRTIRPRSIT
jgi:hypothetical protein